MKNSKTHTLDMTKGSILLNTFRFAIPLMLASILQLLYNAADLIVVSRFAGSNSMASVGATTPVSNLLINVFMGISLGTSVVVSRKFGAKRLKEMHRAVHTSMLLSIVLGIVSGIAGFCLAGPLLKLMGAPEGEVLDGAILYMKIIFLSVPASVIYNFGAAILRAVGDTKRPLYILAVSGAVNVMLNLVFVIGFHMAVEGVAIATAVSNYISMFAVLYILAHSRDGVRVHFKLMRFYKKELSEILKIGVPAGIQSSFFSLSNSVIQSSINSFGAASVAGNAAAGSIEGFTYVAMNAFYQATLTGVSQNYGAQKEKRVNSTIRTSLGAVVSVGLVLSILCAIFSRELLGIYITDSETAIEYGRLRLLWVGIPYFLCGVMEVLTGALRGLGSSLAPAVTTFIGTCGFRIFWVAFILKALGGTIEMLFLCWPVSWVLVIVAHFVTLRIVKKKALVFEAVQ